MSVPLRYGSSLNLVSTPSTSTQVDSYHYQNQHHHHRYSSIQSHRNWPISNSSNMIGLDYLSSNRLSLNSLPIINQLDCFNQSNLFSIPNSNPYIYPYPIESQRSFQQPQQPSFQQHNFQPYPSPSSRRFGSNISPSLSIYRNDLISNSHPMMSDCLNPNTLLTARDIHTLFQFHRLINQNQVGFFGI